MVMNDADRRARPIEWVGRTEMAYDQVSYNLVKRIAATLGQKAPKPGEALPDLWHWAFFQEPFEAAGLGSDGHPARGGFLPPADKRNRMWAGGRLAFFHPLIVGEDAFRTSTILSVEEKEGRSGQLLFVTVEHEYTQRGRLALREEHDIVYREQGKASPGPKAQGLPAAQWRREILPTTTLLFRYSAVTFNGHRIHYDQDYARQEEGYPALVVHGPLIATFMLGEFQAQHPSATVQTMRYRAARPLFAPEPFTVAGSVSGNGQAQVWAGNADSVAMEAALTFVLDADPS